MDFCGLFCYDKRTERMVIMNKTVKIILSILLAILLLLVIVVGGVFVGSKIYYHDFYKNAQRSFSVPGLSAGFIPQGFEYIETSKTYVVSGYMKDSTQASRIYTVDENGRSEYVELLDKEGKPYTGHCGGVAINGEYVYLSSDADGLAVFALSDVLSGGEAKQLGNFSVNDRTSFCSVVDGYLLTGAFYRAESYETPEYHHVTTPAGDENTALIWIYKLDENADFGVSPEAVAALSVREQVQGLAVTNDGKIILSTSWGVSSSQLFLYEIDQRVGSVKDVPLYYLDSANLVETVKAPPMSEELLYLDGYLYIMTESASTKYIFGNLIDARHVWGYQFK